MCTKEKTLTRVILYSRMSCSTEILDPLCLYSLHTRKYLSYIANLTKKKHVFDEAEMKPLHHVSNHTQHCVVSPLSVK